MVCRKKTVWVDIFECHNLNTMKGKACAGSNLGWIQGHLFMCPEHYQLSHHFIPIEINSPCSIHAGTHCAIMFWRSNGRQVCTVEIWNSLRRHWGRGTLITQRPPPTSPPHKLWNAAHPPPRPPQILSPVMRISFLILFTVGLAHPSLAYYNSLCMTTDTMSFIYFVRRPHSEMGSHKKTKSQTKSRMVLTQKAIM